MKDPSSSSFVAPVPAEPSRAPAAGSGRELEDLISPMSCEEFVNAYFARTSLYQQGTPGRYGGVFSRERLQQALVAGQKLRDRRYNITASFTSGEEAGSSRHMIEVQHHQVKELLKAGATICITNIHMADPLLAEWARAVRSQLNFSGTVGVNCYLSADGSGLPTHYDKRVATTLQLEGKKRWRFSTEAAKPWPAHNALYQHGQVEPAGIDHGRPPEEMEFREVELSPGDLLCLPAGAWHSARAVGDSFAVNLYFSPRNFLERLMPLVQDFAASNGDWRAGPPATVEEVRGTLPESVRTYLRERIDEFHRMAIELIDGPDALTESWLNSLTFSPYAGWRPAQKSIPTQVSAEQRFRIGKTTLRFIEFRGALVVPGDSGMMRFPLAVAPVLRRLGAAPATFTIDDVLSWRGASGEPSQQEVLSCLKSLFENGIVELAG